MSFKLVALSITCMSVAAFALGATSPTDEAKAKYNHKFAEVLEDGLVIGYCSGTTFAGLDVGAQERGHKSMVDVGIDENGKVKVYNIFGCGTQPLRKGEVLTIGNVRTSRQGKTVILEAASVPHSLTRGIGAYEHQTVEIGKVTLVFVSNGNADALISKWLRLSNTIERDKLGNTSSMVEVKQVKLGMSYAEVEQVLGVPATRVDLNTKVLYKYKDMTIEFQDGKVSDVR